MLQDDMTWESEWRKVADTGILAGGGDMQRGARHHAI
jgi:hypothetical protein